MGTAIVVEDITQHELRQYHELAAQARQITAAQEALRKSLIARLSDGAAVRPGRFAARIEQSHAQRFSFDGLVRIMGIRKAQAIKDQLPVTSSTSLKVFEVA